MSSFGQFLSVGLAEKAREACLSVGTRLMSISGFEEAAAKVTATSRLPGNRGWRRWSLSTGYAGAAVTLNHLGHALERRDMIAVARVYLDAAINSLAFADSSSIGVIDGITGVCFAARLIDPGHRFTKRVLTHLEYRVAVGTDKRAAEVDRSDCMPFELFDTVSGLAGVGRYWLYAQRWPCYQNRTAHCVDVLTRLLDNQDSVPRWHTPSALNTDKSLRKRFPRGTFNCGMAHGLPGIIALLALALSEKRGSEATEKSLRVGVNWALNAQIYDEYGPNWPTVVPLGDGPWNLRGARAAWCYGAPGVCRALWLAGSALNEPIYKEAALKAFYAVHRRPESLRNIPSPTFCHGLSGLLQISIRFARESGEADLWRIVELLVSEILNSYDPDAYLHFTDIELTHERVDRQGLLEGACGVALALSSAISSVEPVWDALFLLS